MPQRRGDPLANWKKENLAAPRRAPHQAHDIQASVYDDHVPGPRRFEPMSEPADIVPQAPPQPQAIPESAATPTSRGLTEEDKTACPHGDMRWPPPNGSYSNPLHLLLDAKGEKRIYYDLIYKNRAPEVSFRKQEIKSKAQHNYQQKQSARNNATGEEEKSAMRLAIFQAQNSRNLKKVSVGPRGTIWLLDEEHVDVWKCIEMVQKSSPHQAVNLGLEGWQKFELFGVGLKGNKDDVLLVSQSVNVA
jgi:hypothetical protein